MAYRPLVGLYRDTSISPRGFPPEDVRRRIAARLVAHGVEGGEPAILLHHIQGREVPQELLLRMQGAQLRSRTHEILGDVIFRESARKPVVLIVENVHWIDASSEELLKSLVEGVHKHALLLVLTTRPGASLDWLPARPRGSSWRGSPRRHQEMVGTFRGAARSRSRSSSS
jgi:predicted ATPase